MASVVFGLATRRSNVSVIYRAPDNSSIPKYAVNVVFMKLNVAQQSCGLTGRFSGSTENMMDVESDQTIDSSPWRSSRLSTLARNFLLPDGGASHPQLNQILLAGESFVSAQDD